MIHGTPWAAGGPYLHPRPRLAFGSRWDVGMDQAMHTGLSWGSLHPTVLPTLTLAFPSTLGELGDPIFAAQSQASQVEDSRHKQSSFQAHHLQNTTIRDHP